MGPDGYRFEIRHRSLKKAALGSIEHSLLHISGKDARMGMLGFPFKQEDAMQIPVRGASTQSAFHSVVLRSVNPELVAAWYEDHSHAQLL